jgi:hypothetical protein
MQKYERQKELQVTRITKTKNIESEPRLAAPPNSLSIISYLNHTDDKSHPWVCKAIVHGQILLY